MPSGYSNTPLTKKLGFKGGYKCAPHYPFDGLISLLVPLPEDVTITESLNNGHYNMILWCCNDAAILEEEMPIIMTKIRKDGSIWVLWYKKSSGKQLSVNEDIIRNTALGLGLVDVKVCAVDDAWSGLKLVYRLETR